MSPSEQMSCKFSFELSMCVWLWLSYSPSRILAAISARASVQAVARRRSAILEMREDNRDRKSLLCLPGASCNAQGTNF